MAYTTKQEIFEQSNTWVLDLTRQILTQIERHTHPVKAKTEAKIGPSTIRMPTWPKSPSGWNQSLLDWRMFTNASRMQIQRSSGKISKVQYGAAG